MVATYLGLTNHLFWNWGQGLGFPRLEIKVPSPQLQNHGMNDRRKIFYIVIVRFILRLVFLPHHVEDGGHFQEGGCSGKVSKIIARANEIMNNH
eukprot:15362180-Ditylum_brightwellii.AAC.1